MARVWVPAVVQMVATADAVEWVAVRVGDREGVEER